MHLLEFANFGRHRMENPKNIIIKRIHSKCANKFVKENHYSGKVVANSQLHFGAFLHDRLHGVMSFGPSLDKSKLIGLVKGTEWNQFVELNRMAFDEKLPRNSESRSISIAIKLIKKNCPHIKWVVSFADGMQCGDGTIYRASNFKLTGISSGSMWALPQDLAKKFGIKVIHRLHLHDKKSPISKWIIKEFNGKNPSITQSIQKFGGEILEGYMFRYIYFMKEEYEKLLTVPIIPFDKIAEINGKMYKGEKICENGVTVAH